jgi:predicted HicB family RNase H-like nuclease
MKNYHIKAYEYQVKSWKKCAKRNGISVSDWARQNLDNVVLGNLRPSFQKAQMVRGRDPEREEIAISFQFRVTDWQVSEWLQCADSEGLSIGEWCRQVLDYSVQISSLRKAV